MSEPPTATTARLAVPGATLYYKTRGQGPLLVMLQGGDGDADATDSLAAHLSHRFTVLSYDRRGLSRSLMDDPSEPVDLTIHSNDVAHLIVALTDEPVVVFGTSLGALLGLDLLCRHPERVRVLVAHEPPATGLLAEPERSRAGQQQEAVEALFRDKGVAAAMTEFVSMAGVRFDDREPDVVLPGPKPERLANLTFFLTQDAPAVRRYQLDLSRLAPVADRIVPAAGENTETFPRHCAEALAARLGRPLVELPGGHNGPLLRPQALARQLRDVLDAQEAGGALPVRGERAGQAAPR